MTTKGSLIYPTALHRQQEAELRLQPPQDLEQKVDLAEVELQGVEAVAKNEPKHKFLSITQHKNRFLFYLGCSLKIVFGREMLHD